VAGLNAARLIGEPGPRPLPPRGQLHRHDDRRSGEPRPARALPRAHQS
jgi:hypothetical protein